MRQKERLNKFKQEQRLATLKQKQEDDRLIALKLKKQELLIAQKKN